MRPHQIQGKGMNTRTLGLVGLLASAIWLSACGNSDATPQKATDTAEDGKDKTDEAPEIPVEVAVARRGSISAAWRGSATLEAEAEAQVVARASGIVESLRVEEGDTVQAGDVLARLDDDQLRIEVTRAKANMDKLTADFARAREVYAEKIISREAFDRIRFDLQAARAAYDLAQLNLKYAAIRAPIDGVVSTRHIKVGNLVNVNDPAFHIIKFDPLLAVLHVPEREIHKLAVGQTADLRFDAFPERSFTGTVIRINPVVDAGTGTVKTTVEMAQADGPQLKPGMFGRVLIYYDRHDDTIISPGEAVMTEDARDSVFVIRAGQATRVPVTLGFSQGPDVEVLEGIEENDVVVTTGQTSLRDASRVLFVDAPDNLPEAAMPPPKPAEDEAAPEETDADTAEG